jgi:hypothetical protein
MAEDSTAIKVVWEPQKRSVGIDIVFAHPNYSSGRASQGQKRRGGSSNTYLPTKRMEMPANLHSPSLRLIRMCPMP